MRGAHWRGVRRQANLCAGLLMYVGAHKLKYDARECINRAFITKGYSGVPIYGI